MNGRRGFTLIELLVVMAVIATLLTIAVPRYFRSIQRSREAVLRQDLAALRESIDKYYGDTGKYPATLAVLVEKRYLRAVPVDPIAQAADTWALRSYASPPDDPQPGDDVYDVHSRSSKTGLNGVPYREW